MLHSLQSLCHYHDNQENCHWFDYPTPPPVVVSGSFCLRQKKYPTPAKAMIPSGTPTPAHIAALLELGVELVAVVVAAADEVIKVTEVVVVDEADVVVVES